MSKNIRRTRKNKKPLFFILIVEGMRVANLQILPEDIGSPNVNVFFQTTRGQIFTANIKEMHAIREDGKIFKPTIRHLKMFIKDNPIKRNSVFLNRWREWLKYKEYLRNLDEERH